MFLRSDIFQRLSDDKIMKIISSHERQGISKSYFYFLLDRLRYLKIMKDNSIAFKMIIPFRVNGNIKFSNGLAYISSNNTLYYINLEFNEYSCTSCPVKNQCVVGMKKVAKENDIKISKENPREAWYSVINQIHDQIKYKIINAVLEE